MAEAKGIRKEIIRIAADYDIEWKGELENLARTARRSMAARQGGEAKKIDIDKTIDEADELASHSKEQKEKEKAAQRKGEVAKNDQTGKEEKSSVEIGEDKAKKLAKK